MSKVRVRVGARGESCAVAQGAYPVAALRGVRGLASLPERATELYSHGSTHRWLAGRRVCWLDFMDIMDSMVCMVVMARMDLLDCMLFMELMDAGVAHNLRPFYL